MLHAIVAGVVSVAIDPVPGVNVVSVVAVDAAGRSSPPASAQIALP